jgi:hypothetical protein
VLVGVKTEETAHGDSSLKLTMGKNSNWRVNHLQAFSGKSSSKFLTKLVAFVSFK